MKTSDTLKPVIHENGIDYLLCGEYYIPAIEIPELDRPIGHFGRIRKEYLRQQKPALYNHYVLTGKLYEHCAEVNEQAQARLDRIIEQMAEQWGITEDLKRMDQLRWVGMMNNARHSAEELVKHELIYV